MPRHRLFPFILLFFAQCIPAAPQAPESEATPRPAAAQPSTQPAAQPSTQPSTQPAAPAPAAPGLATVAAASQQMNGIAVAPDGRVFVSMPRWIQSDSFSVGVVSNGTVIPYPGGNWNLWKPGFPPAAHFISVNAVRIEPTDPRSLWVLDSAPSVKGGPKLVQLDLRTNTVARVFPLDADLAPPDSYLSDVRLARSHAFITDSGSGAIISLDLATGRARRLLANSTKTKAIPGLSPIVDGRKVLRPDGSIPIVHAAALELSPDRSTLFYCTPLGGFLWQVSLDDLLNDKLNGPELDSRVKSIGPLIPVGGILMLPGGELLLSDVERHAIVRRTLDGKTTIVRQSKLLDWPAAMALGFDGKVYIAVAQVNRMPANNKGRNDVTPPFRILSFPMPK